jgi:hypothetical protein
MPKHNTVKQRAAYEALLLAFAEQLITNGGNGSLALRTVKPEMGNDLKACWRKASSLRRHPKVVDYIETARAKADSAMQVALRRYDVSADRAAAEMARLAYTELRQVCDWGTTKDKETGRETQWLKVRDAVAIDPDAHKALVSIKRKADGSLEVTLADKLAAQMNIARLKGYIQEKPDAPGNAVQLIIQR